MSDIAQNIYLRYVEAHPRIKAAFRASSSLQKMMGKILSRQMGILDAPEEFFLQAEDYLLSLLATEGLELDLEDPAVYPHIRAAINETARNLDMI